MKPQGYPPHNPCYCLYVVILEAVDAGGVVELYQAHIQLHDLTEGMWLEAFYHCCNYEGMWLDAFGDHCCIYYQPVRKRLYHYLGKCNYGMHVDVYLSYCIHMRLLMCSKLVFINSIICLKQTTSIAPCFQNPDDDLKMATLTSINLVHRS